MVHNFIGNPNRNDYEDIDEGDFSDDDILEMLHTALVAQESLEFDDDDDDDDDDFVPDYSDESDSEPEPGPPVQYIGWSSDSEDDADGDNLPKTIETPTQINEDLENDGDKNIEEPSDSNNSAT